MTEFVVLVDEKNNPIGTAPKDTVHTTDTPLHRGFSLFLFNAKKELLVTKRSKTKKTFPGVWTNTVCGHPAVGESVIDAAKRRLNDELGLDADFKKAGTAKQGQIVIKEEISYRYRFADANGIVENEICPTIVAALGNVITDLLQQVDYKKYTISPDPKEVDAWKWVPWSNFLNDIKRNPQAYSPWCIEEAKLISLP